MKVRLFLVLVLILILVAPAFALFHTPPPSTYQSPASGSSVVVIAREDYIYARVILTIQPDGQNQTATLTFPNATAVTITNRQTETIVLPNTIYFSTYDTGIYGDGYHVYGNQPLDVSLLTGENATNFLTSYSGPVPLQGIRLYYVAVDGEAMISTQVLAVSL